MTSSKQCGLSRGQHGVLQILEREPQGALGLDIAAMSGISRAFIYVVLGNLEEQGWVSTKRVAKPGCANRPIYSITENGRLKLAEEPLPRGAVAPI